MQRDAVSVSVQRRDVTDAGAFTVASETSRRSARKREWDCFNGDDYLKDSIHKMYYLDCMACIFAALLSCRLLCELGGDEVTYIHEESSGAKW